MEQKFTDEQFLGGYNRGMSDWAMAWIFGCSQTAVRFRRCKFRLLANFESPLGEKKSPDELEDSRKQNVNTNRIKKQKEKYNTDEDWKENKLKECRNYYDKNLEKENERCKKYHYEHREKRLKQMKEYNKKRKEEKQKSSIV